MAYRKRIYYTEADKALMWDRWQQGESLHAIARHFGKPAYNEFCGLRDRADPNVDIFINEQAHPGIH